MNDQTLVRRVSLILLALIVLDATLAAVASISPQTWFTIFHGVTYNDPEGFLRRCAANWAAFALFQTLALIRWKRQPVWLVLVAGLRFGDMFTDWAYLAFAQNVTLFGKVSLLISSPSNLALGLFLMRAYKRRIGYPGQTGHTGRS